MKNLSSKTKAELIEDINRLTQSIAIKEKSVEAFKLYDQKRKREYTDLQLKLGRVIEHRNNLDADNMKLQRTIDELNKKIARLEAQNFDLSDTVDSLILQIYGDQYDSEKLKNNPDLKKVLMKPIEQLTKVRRELLDLKEKIANDADGFYKEQINSLKDALQLTKKERGQYYQELCQCKSIINASKDVTKVDKCIKAHIKPYEAKIKHLTNEVSSLTAQVKNLKSKLS